MTTTPTTGWDERTKKLVSATVAKELKPADLALLEHIATSRGLDPLNNELYAIPKGGRCTFITSINGMLKVVATMLDGVDVVFYDADGNGAPIWLPKAAPAACAVTVFRKGCSRGFTASARFDDYKGSNLWQKMPSTMIRKVALAAALRLGFSDLLSGLYAEEEMHQAGFSAPAAAAPAPAAPEHQTAPAAPAKPAKARKHAPKKVAETADEAAESLATATGGTVVEEAAPIESAGPSAEDLKAVGLEVGLTTHAIEGIIGLIKGDFAKGIATMKSKSSDDIARLNQKFEPAPATEDW